MMVAKDMSSFFDLKLTYQTLVQLFFSIIFVLYLFEFEVFGIKIHYLITPLLLLLAFILLIEKLRFHYIYVLLILYLLSQSIFGYLRYDQLEFYNVNPFRVFLLVMSNLIMFVLFKDFMRLDRFINHLSIIGVLYISFVFAKLPSEGLRRFTGTFEDPNYFSLLLILFLGIFQIKLIRSRNRILKIIMRISIFICILLIFFTFSRSGILSLVVGLLVALLTTLRQSNGNISFFMIILFKYIFYSFLVLFLVFLYINATFGIEPIMRFIEWRLFSEPELRAGMSRLFESIAGFNFLIKEFPFSLVGMGTGSSENPLFFEQYFPQDAPLIARIHNTYLSILVENGIVGFLLFLYLLAKSFNYLRNYREEEKPYLLMIFVSALISSLFVYNLYYLPWYIVIFYLPHMIKNENIKESTLMENKESKLEWAIREDMEPLK